MILAAAALLSQTDDDAVATPGARSERPRSRRSPRQKTADLGGHAATTEFTDEVIRRTRTKLEVWERSRSVECRAGGTTIVSSGSNCEPEHRFTSRTASSWRKRDAVGTGHRHGVIGVGERENPRLERDLGPAEAVRVAGAVPAFMVVQHAGNRPAKGTHAADHLRAGRGVRADLRQLVVVEGPRFREHCRADGELADVVQRAADPDRLDGARSGIHGVGEAQRERRHPDGVRRLGWIVRRERATERCGRPHRLRHVPPPVLDPSRRVSDRVFDGVRSSTERAA